MAQDINDSIQAFRSGGQVQSDDIATGSVDSTQIASNAVTSAKITDGTVASADLDENTIQYAAVTLTAAQVKALAATQIELVAAPGADKYIEFINATLVLNYGSEAFTESDDNLNIKYTDDSGVSLTGDIESTNFIDQTADTITTAIGITDGIVAASGAVNKALVLDNTGDGEIAGNASNDSTLTVHTAYRVRTAGLA